MDYPGKVITKTAVTPTQTSATGVWTLDDQAAAIKNNNWPVALVPNPISKSLRFNSADTAYLNRTFGTSTNQSIFTYSVWVKLGRTVEATINYGSLLSGYAASSDTGFAEFHFYNGTLRFGGWATNWRVTTQVFRDPSSWYHVILAVDTTQATAANRVKMYVNGSEITAFSTNNNPTQNSTVGINNNSTTGRIGQDAPASSSRLFDGYMAEANFIDGQALTPSDFGLTNPQTGQWIPKKYTGTYGTNGFYLNFKDATSTTTLGYDYSGNGNNWTTNNFSVTAGAGNDSLTDVPTPWIAYNTTGDVGGVVRGNYCTSNPVYKGGDSVLTNGNLNVRAGDSLTSFSCDRGTIAVSSGKWYYEFVQTNIYSTDPPNRAVGWGLTSTLNTTYPGGTGSYSYVFDGSKYVSTVNSAYGASWTTNDVIGLALDLDAGTLVCYKNGVSQGTLASGLSGTFTPIYGRIGNDAGRWIEYVLNFGQRPFAYTPPAGFLSLCTTNLPNPTIGTSTTTQANDYFDVVLWTGNDATSRNITGLQFQPDLVWEKARVTVASSNRDHQLFDAVRGADKALSSNRTDAEDPAGGYGSDGAVTAFLSDGFTVGGTGVAAVNYLNATYVAWNWKANGAGSSNTAGTITSTVSANTTSGFSIVTYTGTGANATVGHGLGVAPSMVIVKRRDGGSDNWQGYHISLGKDYTIKLNTTQAQENLSNYWGSGGVTSTVFGINGTYSGINANGGTYVAYCFAAVAGYSAFGSYTGNGSTDGPFVYTGFRPRWVMFKKTSATSNWSILDTSRDDFNVADNPLLPNLSNAESTSTSTSGAFADILSNGFKVRGNSGDINDSGATYIYAAFAEFPFKFANAR